MKIRIGFISNSSTSSFVVKIRPTYFDKTAYAAFPDENRKLFTLPQEKVELLKKMGFVPTKTDNPFITNRSIEIEDTDFLRYWIVCNQDFVLQFLVANDIPFRASVHYDHWLYSYEPDDGCIYILPNFGMQYLRDPKDLEDIMNGEHLLSAWKQYDQFRKIEKAEFLKDYDEADAIKMMME